MNYDKPPLQGLRCPNCKSKLERSIEPVPHGVVERVYIHTYKCPKCDYVFRRWRKTPTLEVSIKRTLARLSGDIGEHIAFRVLDKKRFHSTFFSRPCF